MSGFEGRRILVVGLGASGFSAARALAGLEARVRVTEESATEAAQARAQRLRAEGIEVEIGGHDLDALDADLAVVSPGVPPRAPVMERLRSQAIDVIGEVELAYRLSRCRFVAVTGTNGKTTTTTLIAAMLEEGGVKSIAAGNIGLPLIDAVATVPDEGVVALEVSSFQLASTQLFHPSVAVLLNVAEDHTDWHGSFEDYAASKARIVANQEPDDLFVYNSDDPVARSVAATARSRLVPFSARGLPDGGVGVRAGDLYWRDEELIALDALPLPGVPGIEDVVAAAGAVLGFGVDLRAVVRAIKSFRGLRHRLELVAEFEGVCYLDDSKATNPHATIAAVQGRADVVLIAGGRSKGIDLSPLARVTPPVIAVVALGEARAEVARVFEDLVPVDVVEDMEQAVAAARRRARFGGSVLLSPACASLDMYESYVARGEDFARSVRMMIERERGVHGES